MTPQLSLTYGASHAGHESWLAELEVLRAAVTHLGHKNVSHEVDVAGSYLTDALNERDRKRWHSEWTHVVIAMLARSHDEVADDIARRILECQAALSRYVVDERKEMTPEDERDAYRAELERLGDAGEKAIAKVLRKKKRP